MSDTAPACAAGLRVEVINAIHQIDASEWDRLAGPQAPFLRHAFLHALEATGCLGERYGWLPAHLLVRDGSNRLVGAAPAYRKFNSYGELVFDWTWADAARRAGIAYYPKLVVAVPYTPATGPRLLVDPQTPSAAERLIAAAPALARAENLSSVHWLFTHEQDHARLVSAGHAPRYDCQYHWVNRGYEDFDAFLATLNSKRRKEIRRERRKVGDAGIRLVRKSGGEITAAEWATWYALYRSTFERRGGAATLSLEFFERIADELPDQLLLVQCRAGERIVAAALNFIWGDVLYGRHWGAFESYDALHFEACYYQGIEHAIESGLLRFEPGAQGEYKILRGFDPVLTRSAHWIADAELDSAVRRSLAHEEAAVRDYCAELAAHSAYRQDG